MLSGAAALVQKPSLVTAIPHAASPDKQTLNAKSTLFSFSGGTHTMRKNTCRHVSRLSVVKVFRFVGHKLCAWT